MHTHTPATEIKIIYISRGGGGADIKYHPCKEEGCPVRFPTPVVEDEEMSNCCNQPILEGGFCSDCKEQCDVIKEEE